MSARRGGLLLLALLLSSAATVARAQPATPDATAKRLYAAALQAYDSGRYDVAIKAFTAAYERAPADLLLFDLAQAYRKKFISSGDAPALAQAIALYRRFLASPATGRERAAAGDAVTELLLLAARQGADATPAPPSAPEPAASKTEIMIVADAANASVALDERAPSPAPLLETVTPGEHHARVAAAGYRPDVVRVTAVEGRFVVSEARLQPLPARLTIAGRPGSLLRIDGADAGTLPLAAQLLPAGHHRIELRLRGTQPWLSDVELGRGAEVQLQARVRPTAARRALRWTGAAALLLGLAAVPAGIVWGTAHAEASDLRARQQATQLTLAERDEYDRARQRSDQAMIATSVTLAAGALLAVTTAALYLFDR